MEKYNVVKAKQVRVENLTPHPITVIGQDNRRMEIPPSTMGVARVEQNNVFVGEVEMNGIRLPVYRTEYGEVQGLPEPQEGTIYIVSSLVAQAVKGRSDVFAVGDFERDDQGRIVGAKGLMQV